jgi:hypothetical protein
MGIFHTIKRAWCADLCGRRIMLTRWHQTHGQVCLGCYIKAMEQIERDEEQRSWKRYTPEERARI